MQLDNLNIDNDVKANEDFMPGDFTKNTGMYPQVVDMAYMGESRNGATSITLHLKGADGKGEHRETFYVTSGTAKGKKNTYVDKSGTPRLLPGMEAMNQLSIILTGTKLGAQTATNKMVSIYSFTSKKNEPTEVPVLLDFIGKPVLTAITKCRDNKQVKVGDDYVDTNAERLSNEASKFLHPDGLSVAEKIAEATEPTYYTKWLKKHPSDYVNDNYTPVAGGGDVAAASSAAASATAPEVSDLFAQDPVEATPAPVAPAPVAAVPPITAAGPA